MKNTSGNNSNGYALITGATSGIGYELAKIIADDGYNLVLVARDQQDLAKVADELSHLSIDVKMIPADLFDPAAPEQVYNQVKSMGIDIEILVNDAGQGQHGKFTETDLRRHVDIIQLNITSLVALTHYFLRDMLKRDHGKILQLGSEVSKMPAPLLAVYAATKAFVMSFSEALVRELKDTGITVTLLMPGATDTDFFDKADMENTKVYREKDLDDPGEVAKLAYDAMKNGDARVLGKAARMNVAMATIMPDAAMAANMEKQMQPSEKDSSETRHQPSHQRSAEERNQSRGL